MCKLNGWLDFSETPSPGRVLAFLTNVGLTHRNTMLAKCVVVAWFALVFAPCMAGPLGGPGGEAARGTSRPTADLSREALEQCLQQEVALGKAVDELKAARARHDAAVTALDFKEAQIKRQRAMLDRTNQKSVDSYNAQVAAHRARIATHNQSQRALSAQASAYQASLSQYKSQCAGKSFLERDRAAVQLPKS